MNNIINPRLTEPGVSYFLRETLKQCNQNKTQYNTLIINISLFALFIGVVSAVLIYKHKTKIKGEELKKKEMEKKTYILTKIKQINDHKQKQYNNTITNLPKFESEFEKMHKNFYNI